MMPTSGLRPPRLMVRTSLLRRLTLQVDLVRVKDQHFLRRCGCGTPAALRFTTCRLAGIMLNDIIDDQPTRR